MTVEFDKKLKEYKEYINSVNTSNVCTKINGNMDAKGDRSNTRMFEEFKTKTEEALRILGKLKTLLIPMHPNHSKSLETIQIIERFTRGFLSPTDRIANERNTVLELITKLESLNK